jgi:HTH-type transcriptional regulator/antitoxin HigA
MSRLKYTVIKSEEQYEKYCDVLEELVYSEEADVKQEEIELLGLLIKDWDEKHKIGPELDPVELIKAFMDEHRLSQTELAEIADVRKRTISEVLNYKKRLSKKAIRNIANHFKIQQLALKKPYRLEGEMVSNSDDEANLS